MLETSGVPFLKRIATVLYIVFRGRRLQVAVASHYSNSIQYLYLLVVVLLSGVGWGNKFTKVCNHS